MSLIEEIHNQHPVVRQIMYWLAVATTLGVIGFFWFTSVEREMFFAIHSSQGERDQFVAKQDARAPQPLATMSKAFGSMTASIGSILGFDSSKGFDRSGQADHNHDAVHPLPVSD